MNSFPLRRLRRFRLTGIHLVHGLGLLLAFLLVASANSTAQYAGIRPNSKDIPRVDVRGTVVNSVTGQAIPRALVTLSGRETYSMLTGSDGTFTFEKVPADYINIQARRPGFFDEAATFVEPDTTNNIVVKLTPAGLIFGQVEDEDGEPVEGAQVRLFEQRVVMGKRRWATGGSAQTNDQGRFRLPNLRPGKYIVAAGPSLLSTLVNPKNGYATVFYPKARDRASATPIEVSAGQQAEADFEFSPVPVFKISGVVTGPKTRGINVFLADSSGSEIAQYARIQQATGEFEIRGVARGTYTLRANGFREQAGPLAAHTTVVVNNDVSGVTLVLHPPLAIPVEVRVDSSQPVDAGAPNSTPSVNIQAVSSTDEQAGGYTNIDGPPQDRRLTLHLPEPGTYDLSITPNGSGYVKAVTCGSTDVLSDPLVVPDSGNVDPIEVVLGSDGAQVSGVVRGGGGPAIVVAVPDNENREPAITGFGPQGQFSFRNLAPGDYSFYAVRAVGHADYAYLESLKPFRAKAVHLSLAPNQKADVTLDLLEADQ